MRKITFFKTLLLAMILLVGNGMAWGQASLPLNATFSTVTTSGPGTMPTGFTQTGLAGYAGSLKFDTQDDYLILNFSGNPSTLTFDLGVNNSFPGTIPAGSTFSVQESDNGTSYTDVSSYSNMAGGTKSISTLKSSTRYIKWIYTTKASGTNISFKNVTLGAVSSCTSSNLAFATATYNKTTVDAAFTQTATSLNGTTAISYSSGTPAVATVNSSTGEVTIKGAGSTIITATQAAGTHNSVDYCAATATYTVNVASTTPTITVTEVTVPAMAAQVGSTDAKTINVSGVNLTDNVTLALSGTNADQFSLSTNSVTQTAGTAPNTSVTITYTPTAQGSHTATLTLTSAGATSVTRELSGTAVWPPLDAPVATEATAINATGLTANWNAVSGATEYQLDVYTKSTSPAADLFISEYGEGSANNKYIEIYNGTGNSVDLSNYTLKQAYNGGGWDVNISYTLPLSGTLANNSVYVISTSDANATILAKANLKITYSTTDQGGKAVSFTGNDAMGLFKNNVLIDVFGDPTSSAIIPVAGFITYGQDHTIVRKSTVSSGNTNWANSSGTNVTDSEWTGYASDTWDYVGSHVYAGLTVTPITNSPFTVTGATSKVITGLSTSNTYYYTVVAKNSNVTSAVSNEITASTLGTGLNNSKELALTASNGQIRFNAASGETIEVFNAIGQKLIGKIAVEGLNSISVQAHGVLLVKVGNRLTKVIL